MNNVVVEVLLYVVVSDECGSSYGCAVEILCNQSSKSEHMLIFVKNCIDLSTGF